MTMTATPPDTTALTAALQDVAEARRAREEIAARLAKQDTYFGHVVRQARNAGATWSAIGKTAGITDVAALKAARRHT